MGNAMASLCAAINDHDLDAFVACFADDYRSEQPAHPSRSFRGADKVRENWVSVFAGIRTCAPICCRRRPPAMASRWVSGTGTARTSTDRRSRCAA